VSPESQVWEMPDQTKSFENFRFENFACERRMNHAGGFQIANLSPHSAHAKFTIVIANIGQPRVGVVLDAHAVNLISIRFERLRNTHWKITPTGNQADAAIGVTAA